LELLEAVILTPDEWCVEGLDRVISDLG